MAPPSTPSRGRAPILLILLLIAGVAVGTAGVLYVGQRQALVQLQQQLAQHRLQAAQLEARNQELADQLAGLQGERTSLEARVTSLRTELAAATQELGRSRASVQEVQDRFRTIDEERTRLQSRVTEVIEEREEARKRADRLAQEKADLERAVGRLRERMALLDRDYRRLEEQLTEARASTVAVHPGVNVIGQYDPQAPAASAPAAPPSPAPPSASSSGTSAVELPPIVVRKDQRSAATPVRGRLVEVNDLHDFVVMDAGGLDGVRAGMRFDILRGAQRVGRVTAARVRPQLSACDVVPANTPGPLQVGDLAVQSSP